MIASLMCPFYVGDNFGASFRSGNSVISEGDIADQLNFKADFIKVEVHVGWRMARWKGWS